MNFPNFFLLLKPVLFKVSIRSRNRNLAKVGTGTGPGTVKNSAYIEVEGLGSVLDDGGMLLLILLRDGELLAPQHRLPPPREQAAQHARMTPLTDFVACVSQIL
jgi:hypothetical protein